MVFIQGKKQKEDHFSNANIYMKDDKEIDRYNVLKNV